jgi:hypothetical protein
MDNSVQTLFRPLPGSVMPFELVPIAFTKHDDVASLQQIIQAGTGAADFSLCQLGPLMHPVVSAAAVGGCGSIRAFIDCSSARLA